MICTGTGGCAQGRAPCQTPSLCGFTTDEGCDTPVIEQHEAITWTEFALHVVVGAVALFCLAAFLVNAWPQLAAVLSAR